MSIRQLKSSGILALVAALGASVALVGCTSESGDKPVETPEVPTTAPLSGDASVDPVAATPAASDSRLRAEQTGDQLPGALSARANPKTAADADSKNRPAARAAAKPVTVDPAVYPIKVTPDTLDMGDIATGDKGTGVFILRNEGTEPKTLAQCKTSCGCTAAKCPKGRTIAPGEEVEIEVSLNGGNTARALNKTVTFIFEGEERLLAKVAGNAVAYVVVEPAVLIPEQATDGQVIVRSIDGEPFRITRMLPPVIADGEFGAEHLEEHVLYLDWEAWEAQGSGRKLTFFVDHPKAERVLATVRPLTPRRTTADANKTKPRDARESKTRQYPIYAVERQIKAGDITTIMKQIEEKTLNLTEKDRTGATVLALAAKHGNVELISALLEAGSDLEAKDNVGRTALMTAAQSKNPDAVKTLLDAGASQDPRDLVGSALSWASGFGDANSVQLLIDAGAELEVAGTATGFTPLIWASGFGDANSVRSLVAAGANLEAKDFTHGATPLMHAARTGDVEKIRILIEAGADLEARDAAGKTPLLFGSEASGATAEMIQALIDGGADLKAVDTRGNTAVDLAEKRTDPRSPAVQELLRSIMGE